MRYLLDTDVLSESRKGSSADPNVAAWFASVLVGETVISVVTLFEIERGVRRMERRDAPQGAMLRLWMRDVVQPVYGANALSLDATIMLRCAALHVPDQRPFPDSLIAATALEHELIVVTRNIADFERMGVAILNPWETRRTASSS